MSPKEQYNKNHYTWLWLIVILFSLVLFNRCTGVDPFQFGGSDQGDRAADYDDSSDERAISSYFMIVHMALETVIQIVWHG